MVVPIHTVSSYTHTQAVRERKDLTAYLWPTVAVAHINVRLALLWSHNCSVHTSPTHTNTHIQSAHTKAHLASSHTHTQTHLKRGYIQHPHTVTVQYGMKQTVHTCRCACELTHTHKLQIPNKNSHQLTHRVSESSVRETQTCRKEKGERRESYGLSKGPSEHSETHPH